MNVVSRCSRMSEAEAEAEQRPTYSSVAAVESWEWAVTSLTEVLFGRWPKNLWIADHDLQSSGPMMVEAEQLLAPMDSHSLRVALEPVLVLMESMVAGLGLEFGRVAMHLLMAAVAVDTGQTSMEVEAGLVLVPGATLVVGTDVVAGAMVAVAGLLLELVGPKRVVLGLLAGVVSTVVDHEAEVVVAVPMGPGAAAFSFVGLEADSRLVTFAEYLVVERVPMKAELVFALEDGSRLNEHRLGVVLAPEVDSTIAGFEGSMHLSLSGAALVPEGTDVIPKKNGLGTDLRQLPEAGLDSTYVMIAAVVFSLVPQPRSSVERAGSNSKDHSLPGL